MTLAGKELTTWSRGTGAASVSSEVVEEGAGVEPSAVGVWDGGRSAGGVGALRLHGEALAEVTGVDALPFGCGADFAWAACRVASFTSWNFSMNYKKKTNAC